jgi:hypothetical protein
MQTKPKQCSRCSKLRPIFKNKTIEGIKSSYCQPCWNIVNKEQAKDKRKKVREKKRESVSMLTKELDRVFSLYIRLRDSNSDGVGKCITCDKSGHYKDFHCGHFRSRKYLSTRWNPFNCNMQCPTCNLYHNGEEFIHGIKIDKKFGEGVAMEMFERSKEVIKHSREDLKTLIKYYQDILDAGMSGIY